MGLKQEYLVTESSDIPSSQTLPPTAAIQSLIALAVDECFNGASVVRIARECADLEYALRALCAEPAFCMDDVTPSGVDIARQMLKDLPPGLARDEALLVSGLVLKRLAGRDPLDEDELAVIKSHGNESYLIVRDAVGILSLGLQASLTPDKIVTTEDAFNR